MQIENSNREREREGQMRERENNVAHLIKINVIKINANKTENDWGQGAKRRHLLMNGMISRRHSQMKREREREGEKKEQEQEQEQEQEIRVFGK